MKSYFTSFELEEGKFKGIIYDATTNQILHTTKLHDSQAGATFEVNEFVSKLKAPTCCLLLFASNGNKDIHSLCV